MEKCSYCGEQGHSIQQCPKWKGKEVATATAPKTASTLRGTAEITSGIFEKLPQHARRVYSISGGVLPEPRYNIAVNHTWVGEWKEVEAYPWLGKVFFPTNWKTKREAIASAERIIEETKAKFILTEMPKGHITVEVFELFGSYPEDRAVIWKNGEETYIYESSSPPKWRRVVPTLSSSPLGLPHSAEFTDPHLGLCRYDGFYITNQFYGGYSAKCEQGSLSADYHNPLEVINIAKKADMSVHLAADAWKEVGRKGWGEVVSPDEAERLLKELASKRGLSIPERRV